MYRVLLIAGVLLTLAACAAEEDLSLTPEPLGQFRLGHNIAIADNIKRGPFSRDFEEAQIETAVQNAVAKRLRRYDGDGLYHLGVVVGALVLAQPGVPVVYAPNSVMIVDGNYPATPRLPYVRRFESVRGAFLSHGLSAQCAYET